MQFELEVEFPTPAQTTKVNHANFLFTYRGRLLVSGGDTSHQKANAPRRPEVGGTLRRVIHEDEGEAKRKKKKETETKHNIDLWSLEFLFWC